MYFAVVVIVIVHLTNSNLLRDFLFFTICWRFVIPIVVQLSPHYRKLKHHIFTISLQLQVHLYFQTWPAFFMLSLLLYLSFPFYASFFSKSMRIFSCVHVSFISWLIFLFDFLFCHGIFISIPFIFSVLTMLLKLPWLTIFDHLNLSFNF